MRRSKLRLAAAMAAIVPAAGVYATLSLIAANSRSVASPGGVKLSLMGVTFGANEFDPGGPWANFSGGSFRRALALRCSNTVQLSRFPTPV